MTSLTSYRRIVVKIGSALLVDRKAGLRKDWLASMAEDIASLAGRGADVLVVSSGAIALGRTILGLTNKVLKLEESQAAAAVGQIALAGAWSDELGRRGLKSGQVLVTLGGPSAKVLLHATEGVLRLRGKWKTHVTASGIEIAAMPTLHPAYLLRNPAHKKLAWRDLLEVRAKLEALRG